MTTRRWRRSKKKATCSNPALIATRISYFIRVYEPPPWRVMAAWTKCWQGWYEEETNGAEENKLTMEKGMLGDGSV